MNTVDTLGGACQLPTPTAGLLQGGRTLASYVMALRDWDVSGTAVTNLQRVITFTVVTASDSLCLADCQNVKLGLQRTEQKGTFTMRSKSFRLGGSFTLLTDGIPPDPSPRCAAQEPVSQFRRKVAKAPNRKARGGDLRRDRDGTV